MHRGSSFDTGDWSIDIAAGWEAEDRDECVALSPPGRGALMAIFAVPTDRGMSAEAWVEAAARVHPPRGRPLDYVVCGDFSGYRTELSVRAADTARWTTGPRDEDQRMVAWMLHSRGIALDVVFTFPEAAPHGRYEAVREMLGTLRRRSTG